MNKKHLNAGAVAAAVLAFASLIAAAADSPSPAGKDKAAGVAGSRPPPTEAEREAFEKSLREKRDAEARATAKGGKGEVSGADSKAQAAKAREEYEQSVRDKKDAAVTADKAARDKAQGTPSADSKAKAAQAREAYEQSMREKSGKGEKKAESKGRTGEMKRERAPMVDPATRAAEEAARKEPQPDRAAPPKKPN